MCSVSYRQGNTTLGPTINHPNHGSRHQLLATDSAQQFLMMPQGAVQSPYHCHISQQHLETSAEIKTPIVLAVAQTQSQRQPSATLQSDKTKAGWEKRQTVLGPGHREGHWQGQSPGLLACPFLGSSPLGLCLSLREAALPVGLSSPAASQGGNPSAPRRRAWGWLRQGQGHPAWPGKQPATTGRIIPSHLPIPGRTVGWAPV